MFAWGEIPRLDYNKIFKTWLRQMPKLHYPSRIGAFMTYPENTYPWVIW